MKSLGQIAYEGYWKQTGISGADLPAWEDQRAGVRVAWEAAAEAVTAALLRMPMPAKAG